LRIYSSSILRGTSILAWRAWVTWLFRFFEWVSCIFFILIFLPPAHLLATLLSPLVHKYLATIITNRLFLCFNCTIMGTSYSALSARTDGFAPSDPKKKKKRQSNSVFLPGSGLGPPPQGGSCCYTYIYI
jgi:hypothetical protein